VHGIANAAGRSPLVRYGNLVAADQAGRADIRWPLEAYISPAAQGNTVIVNTSGSAAGGRHQPDRLSGSLGHNGTGRRGGTVILRPCREVEGADGQHGLVGPFRFLPVAAEIYEEVIAARVPDSAT
jgi:hypothetical protein